MMFQGWNGERTRLVWDTGIIQSLLIPSSNYSTAPLEQQGERKRPPRHAHFHQAALRMKKAGGLEEFMDEEERSDSECSSGCQSGWTLYLGQSQESFTVSVRVRAGEEEEEEDLSMLSDASSGPPLVHEDNNIRYCCCCCCCCCYNEGDGCFANYRDKRRSSEEEKEKKLSFSLEDTASSPLFSCYKVTNTITCSNKKKSESHFKGKNELQKQLGYLHSFCTCESSTGLQRCTESTDSENF